MYLYEALKPLRDAIVDKPPYVSGTHPLPLEMFDLYTIATEPVPSNHLNLARSSNDELVALANACQPATFGQGRQDVMDQTYRKAVKMDAETFATPLVPERTDLVDVVFPNLLEGANSARPVKMELYKLNVYDEGSCFKAHVDTPRSESMFGSLVLVLPTKHQGGSLVFRHRGEEWIFDSAQAVSDHLDSVAFAAFFSGVEHEVLPVTAGQRVTLTYNLYFGDVKKSKGAAAATEDEDDDSMDEMDEDPEDKVDEPTLSTGPSALVSNEATIRACVENALADPELFTNGGTLGFGLRHIYPFSNSISHVPQVLKGSDAILCRVFSSLGFQPTVYLLYHIPSDDREASCLMSRPLDLEGIDAEDFSLADYARDRGGLLIHDVDRDDLDEEVMWVTQAGKLNRQERPFLTYGNEFAIDYAYGDMCLIVRVGKPGERTAYSPPGASREADLIEY